MPAIDRFDCILTKNVLLVWVEFIAAGIHVAVNCDNRKAMGKEKRHGTRLERSTKNNSIDLGMA